MRYNNDQSINFGDAKSTNTAAIKIRKLHDLGMISSRVIITGENLRLDHVAFKYLGDPTLWWAIAALSKIGWGMQLPPGTRLVVPTNRSQIEDLF